MCEEVCPDKKIKSDSSGSMLELVQDVHKTSLNNPVAGISKLESNDVTDAAKLKIFVVLISAFHVHDEPVSLSDL